LKAESSTGVPSYLVPHNHESHFTVAQPKPDHLYGYSSDTQDGAFTPSQILAQTFHEFEYLSTTRLHTTLETLKYPFLTVQVKAAGGAGKRGDLWSATNECAGTSAACLGAADTLDALLLLHGIADYDEGDDNLTVSYAIAVDNNVAQVYVAWMERVEAPRPWGKKYYLQRVDAFLLSRAEDFGPFGCRSGISSTGARALGSSTSRTFWTFYLWSTGRRLRSVRDLGSLDNGRASKRCR
jgi:hypothetical protein